MRGVVKDLLKRVTPWYDEDEATSREESTAQVVQTSHNVRRDAEDEMLLSYRKAGNAIGRRQMAAEKRAK